MEISEFYQVLLSAVFVDFYRVVDRKHIRKIYKPRSMENGDVTNDEEYQQYSPWRQYSRLRRSITPVKLTGIGGICRNMCSTRALGEGVI